MCHGGPVGALVRGISLAGAASFVTTILLVFVLGSAARAAAPPYTLLGMTPGTNFQNWGWIPGVGGGLMAAGEAPTLGLEQNAFAQWTGKRNVIAQVFGYPLGPTGAPSNTLFDELETMWGTGAVPMLAWGQNVQDVNSGRLDGEITALALALKQWLGGLDGHYGDGDDRRIYIRYDWEMNMTWAPWSPCASGGPSPSEFIAAWQHVHNIFASEGLDNTHVAWVFSPNSFDQCSAGAASALYPGAGYVDWFGIDAYWDNSLNCADVPSPSALLGPEVSALGAVDSSKPIGTAEVGIDSLLGNTCKNQWITNYFTYIANNNIRMSVWFNANVGGTNQEWAIFDQVYPTSANSLFSSYGDQSTTYDAFGAAPSQWLGFSAYNTAVQSSSLIGGCFQPCANGRILTDQEFLGQ